jgi:hypothetical protein
MSHQADFYHSRGIFQGGAVGTWTWRMADLDRFMGYAVVPAQANQTVRVTATTVISANDLSPVVTLVVVLGSTNGTSPPGLINFYAARIPPL